MKNLKTTIAVFALAILTSFSALANETTPEKSKEILRSKIVSLIGKTVPVEITDKSMSAEVSFVLSDNNELVVLSVKADHNAVDKFVKSKLNYKKVRVAGIKKGEVYRMPLKIKKPS